MQWWPSFGQAVCTGNFTGLLRCSFACSMAAGSAPEDVWVQVGDLRRPVPTKGKQTVAHFLPVVYDAWRATFSSKGVGQFDLALFYGGNALSGSTLLSGLVGVTEDSPLVVGREPSLDGAFAAMNLSEATTHRSFLEWCSDNASSFDANAAPASLSASKDARGARVFTGKDWPLQERDAAMGQFAEVLTSNASRAIGGNKEKRLHQIITIHSGTGVGKTRLAIEASRAAGYRVVLCDFTNGSQVRPDEEPNGGHVAVAARVAARLFCNATMQSVRARGAPLPTTLDLNSVLTKYRTSSTSEELAPIAVILDEWQNVEDDLVGGFVTREAARTFARDLVYGCCTPMVSGSAPVVPITVIVLGTHGGEIFRASDYGTARISSLAPLQKQESVVTLFKDAHVRDPSAVPLVAAGLLCGTPRRLAVLTDCILELQRVADTAPEIIANDAVATVLRNALTSPMKVESFEFEDGTAVTPALRKLVATGFACNALFNEAITTPLVRSADGYTADLSVMKPTGLVYTRDDGGSKKLALSAFDISSVLECSAVRSVMPALVPRRSHSASLTFDDFEKFDVHVDSARLYVHHLRGQATMSLRDLFPGALFTDDATRDLVIQVPTTKLDVAEQGHILSDISNVAGLADCSISLFKANQKGFDSIMQHDHYPQAAQNDVGRHDLENILAKAAASCVRKTVEETG